MKKEELTPSETETTPVLPFVPKGHLQNLSDLILLDNICMNTQDSANKERRLSSRALLPGLGIIFLKLLKNNL